jgi:hypothetical protein
MGAHAVARDVACGVGGGEADRERPLPALLDSQGMKQSA